MHTAKSVQSLPKAPLYVYTGGETANGGISLSRFAGFVVMFAVLEFVGRRLGLVPLLEVEPRPGASALACHVALRLAW